MKCSHSFTTNENKRDNPRSHARVSVPTTSQVQTFSDMLSFLRNWAKPWRIVVATQHSLCNCVDVVCNCVDVVCNCVDVVMKKFPKYRGVLDQTTWSSLKLLAFWSYKDNCNTNKHTTAH